MKYFLPDGLYGALKWIGLICLPALALLYNSIGPVWDLPYVDQIVTTLNAVGVFIGVIIGASQITAQEVPTDVGAEGADR